MRASYPAAFRQTLAFLALAGAAAGPAAGQITEAEYAARRQALLERFDSGVVVAFGAVEPVSLAGTYRQHPAFRWLTSFDEPHAVLLLVDRPGREPVAEVYVEDPDPRYQLYVGIPEDSASVERRTGLVRRPHHALGAALDSLAAGGLPFYHVRDFGSADAAGRDTLTPGHAAMARLEAEHPDLAVRDAHRLIDPLRAKKSEAELELLRRASDITVDAHLAAMAAIRPGMNEKAVQGVIEGTFMRQGAEGKGFASIVGSGPNSTVLHYMRNDRTMEAEDVVVMDIGASYQGYSSDVTRTVPVDGTFSAEQRAVYEIVLEAQKAAERVAVPGGRRADWQAAADEVIARGLADLGLIEAADAAFDAPWAEQCRGAPRLCRQYALFLPHGLGHGIGLEVHDPAQHYFGGQTFQVGDAFTIEPGIYVNPALLDLLPDTPRNRRLMERIRPAVERYADIGVRIEDAYIVTSDGLQRISPAPREIDEVEAAMRRPPPLP